MKTLKNLAIGLTLAGTFLVLSCSKKGSNEPYKIPKTSTIEVGKNSYSLVPFKVDSFVQLNTDVAGVYASGFYDGDTATIRFIFYRDIIESYFYYRSNNRLLFTVGEQNLYFSEQYELYITRNDNQWLEGRFEATQKRNSTNFLEYPVIGKFKIDASLYKPL